MAWNPNTNLWTFKMAGNKEFGWKVEYKFIAEGKASWRVQFAVLKILV